MIFNLAYTELKSDVVAPEKCLLVIDIWSMSGYMFVLYIPSPFPYIRWIEEFNSNRIVKLLNGHEEDARRREKLRYRMEKKQKQMDREEKRKMKIVENMESEMEKQTDAMINNKFILHTHGNNQQKSGNSDKGTGGTET